MRFDGPRRASVIKRFNGATSKTLIEITRRRSSVQETKRYPGRIVARQRPNRRPLSNARNRRAVEEISPLPVLGSVLFAIVAIRVHREAPPLATGDPLRSNLDIDASALPPNDRPKLVEKAATNAVTVVPTYTSNRFGLPPRIELGTRMKMKMVLEK